GIPDTDSATLCAAPDVVEVAIAQVVPSPTVTEPLAGVAEIEKSFGTTVSATLSGEPSVVAVEIVDVVPAPAAIEPLAGAAEIEKSWANVMPEMCEMHA